MVHRAGAPLLRREARRPRGRPHRRPPVAARARRSILIDVARRRAETTDTLLDDVQRVGAALSGVVAAREGDGALRLYEELREDARAMRAGKLQREAFAARVGALGLDELD